MNIHQHISQCTHQIKLHSHKKGLLECPVEAGLAPSWKVTNTHNYSLMCTFSCHLLHSIIRSGQKKSSQSLPSSIPWHQCTIIRWKYKTVSQWVFLKRDSVISWHYHAHSQKCTHFIYSGVLVHILSLACGDSFCDTILMNGDFVHHQLY